jgi:mRNA interferase YafQ
MRTIEWTLAFKRDFKKASSTPRHRDFAPSFEVIADLLAKDESLGAKYRDHALSGDYSNHRECHLKPDLLLIYKKPDSVTLRFVRLGSHSELF